MALGPLVAEPQTHLWDIKAFHSWGAVCCLLDTEDWRRQRLLGGHYHYWADFEGKTTPGHS